jgi:DNA-binding transcriptional ArsR family regulator
MSLDAVPRRPGGGLTPGAPAADTTLQDDAAKLSTGAALNSSGSRQASGRSGHARGQTPRHAHNSGCEWSGFFVCSASIDHSDLIDYEAEDVLVVQDQQQLRALADTVRTKIVFILRERAASITELAEVLGSPKGTVGHHVKVLERAGLIRVVRTRKVRALTEKYYGRVARLFVLRSDESLPDELTGVLGAAMLQQAADEALASRPEKDHSALLHIRLGEKDVLRFQRRLNRLVADFQRAEDPSGDMHALTLALFRSTGTLPPRRDDA